MASYYETNSSTDVNDLITKFKTALVTNCGYTENSFVTEGTGKRLHLSKGNRYFNFRSFVAENTPVGGTLQTGIFMNAGTGYSSGSAWYDQAGVLKYDGNTKYLLPGMVQLSGAIVAYHLYWFQDTNYDVVYFFVESPAGTFQRLLFGRMDRSKYGTHWTTDPEGMFYQGSQGHNSNLYSNALNLFGENQQGYWNHNNAKGAIYGTVGGTTNWISGDFTISQSLFSPTRVQCFDSISRSGSLWMDSPNSFNSLPPQIPVTLNITLSAGSTLSSATPNIPWCPVGELPFLYWINLLSINPGANISVSTDTYKVFPFRKKSDTWSAGDSSVGTFRFGLSVKNI
ncbi:MAG TPA: hypothetical protein PLP33_25855 [Leptospiraceae bacterium]|nr:hypothetical protein [Leptospiraceae bacterium]